MIFDCRDTSKSLWSIVYQPQWWLVEKCHTNWGSGKLSPLQQVLHDFVNEYVNFAYKTVLQHYTIIEIVSIIEIK